MPWQSNGPNLSSPQSNDQKIVERQFRLLAVCQNITTPMWQDVELLRRTKKARSRNSPPASPPPMKLRDPGNAIQGAKAQSRGMRKIFAFPLTRLIMDVVLVKATKRTSPLQELSAKKGLQQP